MKKFLSISFFLIFLTSLTTISYAMDEGPVESISPPLLNCGIEQEYAKKIVEAAKEPIFSDLRVLYRKLSSGKVEILTVLGEIHGIMKKERTLRALPLIEGATFVMTEGDRKASQLNSAQSFLIHIGMGCELPYMTLGYTPARSIFKACTGKEIGRFCELDAFKVDKDEYTEAISATYSVNNEEERKEMMKYSSPIYLAEAMGQDKNSNVHHINLEAESEVSFYEVAEACVDSVSKLSGSICTVSLYLTAWSILWNQIFPSQNIGYVRMAAAIIWFGQNYVRPAIAQCLSCIAYVKDIRWIKKIDPSNYLIIDRDDNMLKAALEVLARPTDASTVAALIILGKAHLNDITELFIKQGFLEIPLSQIQKELAEL